MIDPPHGKLSRYLAAQGCRQPGREGIGGTSADRPPVFPRFATVECRSFHLYRASYKSDCDHVVGNMRRVLLMVSENSYRVLGCRWPVGVRGGSKRRLRDRSSVNVQCRPRCCSKVIPTRYLHEEIVGVLAVHDRNSEGGFARLEKLRIPARRYRRRLQAQHCPQSDRLPSKVAGNHRHQPIGRKQLCRAARTARLCIDEEAIGVKHQRPASEITVHHGYELGCRPWLNTRSGRDESNGVFHRRHTRHLSQKQHNQGSSHTNFSSCVQKIVLNLEELDSQGKSRQGRPWRASRSFVTQK